MLIVALILAVIGLAALVTAVVTSNELIAWVCIGASGLGVLLLIVDAIRDRATRRAVFPTPVTVETTEVIEPVEATEVIEALEDENLDRTEEFVEETAEPVEDIAVEDHPDELIHDEPDYDTPSDDEEEFPEPAEEAAIHIVSESDLAVDDPRDDLELAEGYVIEEAPAEEAPAEEAPAEESVVVSESSATEVYYTPSPEGSADTVVHMVSESTATENLDTGESQVGEERRDQ